MPKINLQILALKEIHSFCTSLKLSMQPCRQPIKQNLELPSKFCDKKRNMNASRERYVVYNIISGKAKSAGKNLAACKLNQQINGKKWKKRTESASPLNELSRLQILDLIHQLVCCSRMWKSSLKRRVGASEETAMSDINDYIHGCFCSNHMGDSVAITLCARRG